MEEILSSIKKIIADDSDKGLSVPRARRIPIADVVEEPVAEAEPYVVETAEDDVLELTSEADETAIAAAEEPVAPAQIVSESTVTASRSALESLSAMVVKPEVHGNDTLEGMVREMLRPVLKEWLDARLPEMVESMVAKEIAKITGRV